MELDEDTKCECVFDNYWKCKDPSIVINIMSEKPISLKPGFILKRYVPMGMSLGFPRRWIQALKSCIRLGIPVCLL